MVNHVRRVFITSEWLAEMLGHGTSAATPLKDVPGLKVLDARYDKALARLELLVWSASFSPVETLEPIPVWYPTFVRGAA